MFLVDNILKDSAIGKLWNTMVTPFVDMAMGSPKYFIGAVIGGLAKAALAKKAASAAGKGLAKTGLFGRKMMNNPGAFGNMVGGFFGGNPLGGLGAIGKGAGLFGKAGGFLSGGGKLAQMGGKLGGGLLGGFGRGAGILGGGLRGAFGGLMNNPAALMNPMGAAMQGMGQGVMGQMPRFSQFMDKGAFGGGRMGQGTGLFGKQGGFGSGKGFFARIGKGGDGFMGNFGTGQGAIGNMAPNFRTGQGRIAQMFNKGGAGNTGNMNYAGQRGPFGRQGGFGQMNQGLLQYRPPQLNTAEPVQEGQSAPSPDEYSGLGNQFNPNQYF